jgi:hypothetical protein
MTWWLDDISNQQRVNAIASRNATKLRSRQPRDINWDSVIERFQQTIAGITNELAATPAGTILEMIE